MKKDGRRQRGRETTRKIYWKGDRSSFRPQNISFQFIMKMKTEGSDEEEEQ